MTTPSPADLAAAAAQSTGGAPSAQQASQDGNGGTGAFDPNAPTISQSHMNHLLAEEKRKWQERYGDYDEIKERAEKFDTLVGTTKSVEEQAAELNAKLATRERDVAELNLTIERQKLAAEAGIPAALWSMIGGTNEASIKANIDILKTHTAAAKQEQDAAAGASAQQRRGRAPGQGRPGANGDAGAGGSVASGRDLYVSRQPSKGK